MKITFIGAGNMSEAIIAGVLKQEVVAADAVTVSDPLEERRKHMQQAYGSVYLGLHMTCTPTAA